MLSLSATTGYAIKALSCMDSGACASHHITAIARCASVPRPYLAKIVRLLAQHGLVATRRGYTGGIILTRPAAEISLLEIVVAVEGEAWIGQCLIGLDDCRKDSACPTRRLWERISRDIRTELGALTLADVIRTRGELSATCRASSKPHACFSSHGKSSRKLSISAVGVELNA